MELLRTPIHGSNRPVPLPARIWQKVMLGFGIALVMLVLTATVAYRSTRGLIGSVQRVAHAWQVLEMQESLQRHWMEADSAARAYLLAADEQFLPDYEKAQQGMIEDFKSLKTLTQTPAQQKQLGELQPLISQKLSILKSAIAVRRNEGLDAAARLLGNGEDRRVSEQARALLTDFGAAEQQLLEKRSSSAQIVARSATIIIVTAALLSGVILVAATVMILRDIAARRRAEDALEEEHNLLRNVIDAMPEHVFVKNLTGCYVIDNKAHCRFLGATSLREVEGKTVHDFFPPDVAREFAADDESVLKTGISILNREEAVVDDKGGAKWLSTTKVPLLDRDGKRIGLVGVSSDITTRKQAQEKERILAEQLRRSNRELEEFASIASHDLQEPLRKIQAFGDRLETKFSAVLGETGRDYLERMQDAARRMRVLLQDLLTLSRVTSKAQPFVPVDLKEIVHDVISDLEVRIEQNGAKVELGFLPTIDADPIQMRQLFQNLIANALKFQRPGVAPEVIVSGKIVAGAETQAPGVAVSGGEVVQMRVQDNGIGFDEKYAERIFQVFQRLHSRSEYEGTGIGLAVCRKIVARHGGGIFAKSAEGEGATFIVTLPIKQSMKNGESGEPTSSESPQNFAPPTTSTTTAATPAATN